MPGKGENVALPGCVAPSFVDDGPHPFKLHTLMLQDATVQLFVTVRVRTSPPGRCSVPCHWTTRRTAHRSVQGGSEEITERLQPYPVAAPSAAPGDRWSPRPCSETSF